MAYPIHIVGLNHNDILRTGRWEPFRALILGMNDQERGEMRQLCIATCAEVMRDCDDWQVRADAYELLRKLKVVHP